MRPTTPRPATASPHDLHARQADEGYDRTDPRIHSSPATPAKPYTATWRFWLTALILAGGLVLTGLAQPAVSSSPLPGWMMLVGYGIAVVGAFAMFFLWVRYRAR